MARPSGALQVAAEGQHLWRRATGKEKSCVYPSALVPLNSLGFVRAGEAASSFQSDLQQCGYWEGSLHPAFLSVCVISVFVPQSHSRLRMYCWSLNVHGHVCHFGRSGAAAELPSVWVAPRICTLNVRRK